ncbi:MAG: PQQ-binding-like beta-propeller repeat protein [Candidatus Methanoperedens sp.]|nr:PQQ-binding-like beta-propeller repeat protein [Candidatus Methanoperedens sp.]
MKKLGGMAVWFLALLVILIVAQAVQAGDWPMFRHDTKHTGIADEVVEPPLDLLWRYRAFAVGSSPAVSGGIVYVSSYDGYMYAINASTGDLKWKYQVGASSSPSISYEVSSPAVSGSVVYVMGSENNNVYAIDASTGSLRWEYKIGGYSRDSYSPAVSEGVVYVSTIADIQALDASTGSLKWSTGIIYAYSSPAVSEGIVYVGTTDGYVYALDAITGAIKWEIRPGGASGSSSSPTVLGGMVYVGSDDKYVYALDAKTGIMKWKYLTGGGVYSSPAVYGGIIYVGSDDNYMYALDGTTGSLKWKYQAGGSVRSSPAVSGSVVYIGSDDNYIHAIDASTGSFKWKYQAGNHVRSSPAVSGGAVYMGSWDGYIYAFVPAPTPTLTPTPMMTATPIPTTTTPTPPTPTPTGTSVPTPTSTEMKNMVRYDADKKTIVQGETWDIGGGYTLTVQEINIGFGNPSTVRLVLSRNGIVLDDKVLAQGMTYTYNDIISFKIYSFFAGANADMVQFRDVYISSQVAITPTPAVDIYPPSISISKEIVDFNKNGQLDEGEKLVITYGANDESGVKSIKLLVDGNLIELRNNEGIYFATTDPLSMGEHSIVVEAIDSKGNKKVEEMKVNVARGSPSVYFPKLKYEVNEGEDVNVVLSAVNPIGNPKMDAQLILKPPSTGVYVYESDCKSNSGMCTSQFEIGPGDSVKPISVRMRADRPGEYQIDAEIYYQFEGGTRSPTRYETVTLIVKPKPAPQNTSQNPIATATQKSIPGFGITIGIISLLFAVFRKKKKL